MRLRRSQFKKMSTALVTLTCKESKEKSSQLLELVAIGVQRNTMLSIMKKLILDLFLAKLLDL